MNVNFRNDKFNVKTCKIMSFRISDILVTNNRKYIRKFIM